MKSSLQLIPAGQELVDSAKTLLGPASEEFGQLLADRVRYWRWRSALKILRRSKEIQAEEKIEAGRVSLKFFLPCIEEASKEEESSDALCELWARLLARSGEGTVAIDLLCLQALKSIGSIEAELLSRMTELGSSLETIKKSMSIDVVIDNVNQKDRICSGLPQRIEIFEGLSRYSWTEIDDMKKELAKHSIILDVKFRKVLKEHLIKKAGELVHTHNVLCSTIRSEETTTSRRSQIIEEGKNPEIKLHIEGYIKSSLFALKSLRLVEEKNICIDSVVYTFVESAREGEMRLHGGRNISVQLRAFVPTELGRELLNRVMPAKEGKGQSRMAI